MPDGSCGEASPEEEGRCLSVVGEDGGKNFRFHGEKGKGVVPFFFFRNVPGAGQAPVLHFQVDISIPVAAADPEGA